MAKWRAKANEMLPDLRQEIAGGSIYAFFGGLLDELSRAARANNISRVVAIFAFAEWCSKQPAKDVWNAAGVSFYEHLGDDPEVHAIVHLYLSRTVFFAEVEGLMKAMGRGTEARAIRDAYGQLP